MALYVLGDLHIGAGAGDEYKLFDLQGKATMADIVVNVGDCGAVWYGDDYLLTGSTLKGRDGAILDQLNDLGFIFCFIDGNHEGFHALAQYPVVDFCGGKAHKLRDNVYHLMRNEIFNLQGHICWTFGGAASVDKAYRTEGVSWWKEELASADEITAGYKKALDASHIDYIFTHQVPQWVKETVFAHYKNLDDKFMMKMFNELYTEVDFKKWYCGHMHVDKEIGQVRILYHDVVKID